MNLKISPPLILNPNDFQLGFKPIDEQHAEIISAINDLYLERFSGNLNLEPIIEQLNDHVNNHFRYEESLMVECNYPHIREHVSDHLRLVDESSELIHRSLQGEDISSELQEFLFNMLRHHIGNVDRRMVAYYLNFLSNK